MKKLTVHWELRNKKYFYRLNYKKIIHPEILGGVMYERMLNKQAMPTVVEMIAYCAENANLFSMINDWISLAYHSEQKVVFPYGNNYGWGIGHYKKKKLICNIFPEKGAFTVMIRLTNTQCEAIYPIVATYTQNHIDKKYPCGNGGWIHYRVICQQHYEDILKIIQEKCL